MDAAGEFRGYCSDITRTFPVSGRFTAAQRQIYNIVLAAQTAAIALIKPGVLFNDLELAAAMELVKGLEVAGLIHNGTLQDYLNAGVQGLFMPHGLGHCVVNFVFCLLFFCACFSEFCSFFLISLTPPLLYSPLLL